MTSCSFTINEPGCDLSLETMVIDPLCAGDTTGIIDLTIKRRGRLLLKLIGMSTPSMVSKT
jgi:hypothetical protein